MLGWVSIFRFIKRITEGEPGRYSSPRSKDFGVSDSGQSYDALILAVPHREFRETD